MLNTRISSYVFFIEEDEAVCEGLTMALQSFGLVCLTFTNTKSFVEFYQQGTSGCIVVDNDLSGQKGFELKADLSRHNIQLPLIFLNSYGDHSQHVDSMVIRTGTDLYIPKPFPIELLAQEIQVLLQNETE
jgi:FixJ family two-component response regulator